MIRREVWVPVAVVGVAVAFVLVSWLVKASRGNPWLVRRKLAVGAVLLSLTWSASGCGDGPGSVTCYAPIPLPNQVDFDGDQYVDGVLQLDLAEDTILVGQVHERTADQFAFLLADGDDDEVDRGEISPADGAYDTASEAVELDLSQVSPGNYTLEIYTGSPADINRSSYLHRVPLVVVAATR